MDRWGTPAPEPDRPPASRMLLFGRGRRRSNRGCAQLGPDRRQPLHPAHDGPSCVAV